MILFIVLQGTTTIILRILLFTNGYISLTNQLNCREAGQQLPQGTLILSTGYTCTEFTFKGKSKFDYNIHPAQGDKKVIVSQGFTLCYCIAPLQGF
ncbi:MAG: hypothetical protein ABI760_06935, partial [Ferruginibacter sp.]